MAFWNKRRKKQAPAQEQPPQERLLSYRVANLQGIGTRQNQEDAFAFVNAVDVTEMKRKGLLALVADGMGGMEGGKIASETVIAAMKDAFGGLDRQGNLAESLKESVIFAGKQVFETLGGRGGSTLVACLFYEEQLYFASVGDSYLYLLRDGELLRLNRPHNVRQELWLETIHSGSMDPEPACADREADALTQFLGMDAIDDVDYLHRPLALREGDLLLLCSDGVAGVLTEAEISACLQGNTPDRMCSSLEQAILAQNGKYQDNYTALVIRCGY